MSITAILEVGIGMIFAWLIISLSGMYIQEIIVKILGWRSSMLENHLGNMLTDPNLARQLYDHPLIKSLHTGIDGSDRPSYIPSAQFSMALMDMIKNAPKEAALIQKTLYELQDHIDALKTPQRKAAQEQLDLALDLTKKAISSEGGPENANALLDEVKKHIRKLSQDFPSLQPQIEAKFVTFAQQKKQIDAILATLNPADFLDSDTFKFMAGLAAMSVTYPILKQAIGALVHENAAEKIAERAKFLTRQNIEEWFDNSMERLSGWYKRRSQTIALIIGLSIALLFNVDSLTFATQLWRDPAVRMTLAAQAQATVEQNPSGFSGTDANQLLALNTEINQLNIPIGWVGTVLPADASGAVSYGDGTSQLCTLVPTSAIELFGFHFDGKCYPIINTPHFNDWAGWLLKLVGLLITGLAAAQGAPFWFDILKNVVNVRSVGANPGEKSKG